MLNYEQEFATIPIAFSDEGAYDAEIHFVNWYGRESLYTGIASVIVPGHTETTYYYACDEMISAEVLQAQLQEVFGDDRYSVYSCSSHAYIDHA